MVYLWLAGAAAVAACFVSNRKMPRHGHPVLWLVAAGFVVAGARGLEPTLFRAENGLLVATLIFGIPGAVVGLIAGLLVHSAWSDYRAAGQ